MWDRIKECKSLEQRKKDNNDPLTHPIYFVRDASEAKGLAMDQYYNKLVSKNLAKSPSSYLQNYQT